MAETEEEQADRLLKDVFEDFPKFEIWCWLNGGIAATNVSEETVAQYAEKREDAIFFFAELTTDSSERV